MKLSRKFAQTTKNAIHIIPPLNTPKINTWTKEICGVKLPIMEKIPRRHCTKKPPTFEMFDDSNPENHLKVETPYEALNVLKEMKQDFDENERRIPFILGEKSKIERKTETFKTIGLKTSAKKSTPVIRTMIGRLLYDAIMVSKSLNKKVGDFLGNQLETKFLKQLEEEGYNLNNIFVTSIVVNRYQRKKKLRFGGKAKVSMMKRDYCLFKITVTEKSVDEMFKMMIQGKSPVYFMYMMRNFCESKQAPIEMVREMQVFLTAKGRQQYKLMVERRIMQKWLEYRRRGIFVRLNVLREIMIEKEVEEFKIKYQKLFPLSEDIRRQRIKDRTMNVTKFYEERDEIEKQNFRLW